MNDVEYEQEILDLKTTNDDFAVEYKVYSFDSRAQKNEDEIKKLDEKTKYNQKHLEGIEDEIDRLTNHSDGIDYTVAVSCGILTGLIDAFFVGEFDLAGSRDKVGEKFDELVKKKANELREKEVQQKAEEAIKKAKEEAKKNGKTFSEEEINKIREKFNKKLQKPLDKEKSIRFLEERFSIPSDSVYEKENEKINETIKKIIAKAEEEGNPLTNDEIKKLKDKLKTKISDASHHLDDLTHHPTIIGWAASMAQQFGAKAVFQNREGKTIPIKVEKVKKVRYGKEIIEIQLIGNDIGSKFACGTVNWIMHLLSDAAGSSGAARRGTEGMGLPGPLVSLLKEVSLLPGLNKTNLPEKLYDLFTKEQDFLNGYKLDLRTELAIGAEIGKQAIIVFINSIFIRCFYFIRRFVQEVKNNNGFKGLNVKNALKRSMPFRNRTVTRMLTISLGTFEAVDLGDAIIHGAIKSGGTAAGFFAGFIVRINFVGIGRFTIAVASDVKMGIEKGRYENQKSIVLQNMILSYEAKMYYRLSNAKYDQVEMHQNEARIYESEEDLWKQVYNTEASINELNQQICKVAEFYTSELKKMDDAFDKIEDDINELRDSDPDLLKEMLQRLI